jgi:hypothetical protein
MSTIKKNRKLFFGKTLLIAFVATLLITVVVVYITGISSHRAILDNAIISLTVLWGAFFLFVTIGLFNGFDIKDDLSHKLHIKWRGTGFNVNTHSIPENPISFDVETGDGIEGCLASIVLWIVATIAFLVFLIFFEFVLWAAFLGLVILIYWILMRALKLIFSKSQECENDLPKSIYNALVYTTLYVSWLYGVIYFSSIF